MDRDPLVTPAVGDVIEGERGGLKHTMTVTSIEGDTLKVSDLVTYPGLFTKTVDLVVPVSQWQNWPRFSRLRVVHAASEPVRDPLVNPEPGDVVRATAKQTGHRYVFLVTHAVDDMVYGVAFCVETRHRVDIIRALSSWGDWSNWIDVKVLS